MTSKWLRILLSAVAVFVLWVTVCAVSSAADDITEAVTAPDIKIRVDLFDAKEAYTEVQALSGEGKNEYALFLPAGCDRNNLRVTFDYEKIVIGSETIKSGGTTAAFAEDKTVNIETDAGIFQVKVCSSENLPAVFIITESGDLSAIHADKNYKEKASFTLAEKGEALIESRPLAHIKGRGNSSWRHNEKRSYNIKFAEKTGIMGMAAARKWALISNNIDPTLMRNAIVYTAAKMTKLPYTVDFRFADVYINGNYRGNYIICEKIEVNKNRININDLEKANEKANAGIDLDDAECIEEDVDGIKIKYWDLPNEPDDISGGYLLEYDGSEAKTAPNGFVTRNDIYLRVHSPEHITKNEIKYISSLYDEFEQALFSPEGKNSKGKSYLDYIDVDSFVDAAVINEFTMENDGGYNSWYIFLPEGSGKFFAGPAWDFDLSMESAAVTPESVRLAAEKRVRSSDDFEKTIAKDGNVLMLLLSKDDFARRVADRSVMMCKVFKRELNNKVSTLFDTISASAVCDNIRWGYEVTNEDDVQLRYYVTERSKSLKKYFSNFNASVRAEAKRMRNGENPDMDMKKVVIVISVLAGVPVIIACGSVIKKKKRGKKNLKDYSC